MTVSRDKFLGSNQSLSLEGKESAMNEPIKPSRRDNVISIDRRQITPSSLRRQAQELIAAGKMPSLAELLSAVAEVREEYRPLILAARKERDRGSL